MITDDFEFIGIDDLNCFDCINYYCPLKNDEIINDIDIEKFDTEDNYNYD